MIIARATTEHMVRTLYAAIAVDAEGSEGLCGVQGPAGWLPAIVSQPELLAKMRRHLGIVARALQDQGGKIVIRRYDFATDIEIITPTDENEAHTE